MSPSRRAFEHIHQAFASLKLAHVDCSLRDSLQVTPSSKVVGDLAQFMVQNNLSEKELVEQADQLSVPDR